MPNYEDGFYKKDNIIGYTGDISRNPTVYFQKGNKFGRITQDHPKKSNIGRNKVRVKSDYCISNSTKTGKAQEFYDGAVKHRSRHKFIKAGFFDRIRLSKALDKFKDLKPKYNI